MDTDKKFKSMQFMGGEKSNIEAHPAYLPNIFPPAYKKPNATQSQVTRVERASNRNKARLKMEGSKQIAFVTVQEKMELDNVILETVTVSTQVSFKYDKDGLIFYSLWVKNNLSIQYNTNLTIKHVSVKHQSCGPSDKFEICKFDLLLSLLSINLSVVLSQKNVLLLF